jgi:hypothetical protein
MNVLLYPPVVELAEAVVPSGEHDGTAARHVAALQNGQ